MNSSLLISNTIFIFILSVLASTAFGDTHNHQHHSDHEFSGHQTAHQHGIATANITFEKQVLLLELQLPAQDVFGFEHQPENQQQLESMQNAAAVLSDSIQMFSIHPACKLVSGKMVEPAELKIGEVQANHLEHSNVTMHYRWDCSQHDPEKMELHLFRAFPTISQITIQFVSDERQQLAVATPDRPHFLFID